MGLLLDLTVPAPIVMVTGCSYHQSHIGEEKEKEGKLREA